MRRVLYSCAMILAGLLLKAQHSSDYIQYMFNGMLLNPAYAGSREALDITALYRKQWVGMDGTPVTLSLGAHAALKNKKYNLGLLAENDRYGLFNHNKVQIAYAYRIGLKKGQLALGLQAGLETYASDWSRVQMRDQNDPNFADAPLRNIYPVAGTGFYYHHEKFYAGMAAPALLKRGSAQPDEVVFHGGCLLRLSELLVLKPAFILKYLPPSAPVVNLSSTIYYTDLIGLGVGYTHQNAAFLYTDIRLNDQFRFGYGYARALSALSVYTSGTHEVMLRYFFRYRISAVSPRYF